MRLEILIVAAYVAGISLARSLAADTGQLHLQVEAAKLNDRAANASMQSATGFAMNALMELSAMNIGGAVRNGVTAYGNYRNSESLDFVTDMNIQNANKLENLTSAPEPGLVESKNEKRDAAASSAPFGAERTTFRRLDKKFLYEGKMSEIATEFEKRSGMNRERFLDALATVSEQKISAKDPEVFEKAFGRFRAFVDMIPNQEFRGGLDKAINLVPETVQRGLVGHAISKAINFVADLGDPPPADAEALAAETAAPAANAPAALVLVANEPGRAPAAEVKPALPAETIPSINAHSPLVYEMGAQESARLLSTELDTDAGDATIFAMVSKRYRRLTPGILDAGLGKVSVNAR